MNIDPRIRRTLARAFEYLAPAPSDLGLTTTPTTTWEEHVESALAAANGTQRLTGEDLLGLASSIYLAPSRPHEPSAAERAGNP